MDSNSFLDNFTGSVTQRNWNTQVKKILEQTRIKHVTATEKQTPLRCSGTLEKKSKFFGVWKKRYTELREHYLFTFEREQNQLTPTEFIQIGSIEILKKEGNPNRFYIYGNDKHGTKNNFYFACKTSEQRDQWVSKIQAQVLSVKKLGMSQKPQK